MELQKAEKQVWTTERETEMEMEMDIAHYRIEDDADRLLRCAERKQGFCQADVDREGRTGLADISFTHAVINALVL